MKSTISIVLVAFLILSGSAKSEKVSSILSHSYIKSGLDPVIWSSMEKAIGKTSRCLELIKIILPPVLLLATSSAIVAQNYRARDFGIPLDGIPGDLNAITDVRGVESRTGNTHLRRWQINCW